MSRWHGSWYQEHKNVAFVLTYQALFDTVVSYLERADARLLANIPVFISNAQRRVATKLKLLGFKQSEIGVLIPANSFIIKDVRWLANESMNIKIGPNFLKQKQLYHRTPEFCKEYWPTTSLTAEPVYYCTTYNQYEYFFVPTPDLAYPYESIYFATPQLLDQSYDQNFLTTGTPRLLLYATLSETAPFLHDDDRVPLWEKEFNDECRIQGIEDEQRIVDVQGSMGDTMKEMRSGR